ncbi:MAG: hypothetical protein RL432_1897 [Bacteroidota bacterium]
MSLFRCELSVFAAFILLSSCAMNSGPGPLNLEDASIQWAASDSTKQEEILTQQRALAMYILSLPSKERAQWVSSTLSEEQMKAFTDTLQKPPK